MTSFAAAVGRSAPDSRPFTSDWDSVPFERCIKRERGLFEVGKLNQDQYHPTGKYPIIDQGRGLIAGFSDDGLQVYRGPLPVVLFGDHTIELKYVRFPFICGADGVKVLVPDESLVVPEFFYYFLKQAPIPSRGYNRHYRLLRELRVPLPCKDEQRRIARVLSTIQRAIEAQEKVIAAARELKRSLMKHLFTYGPIPITETACVPLKETEIGPVPEDWEVAKLGDIADARGGCGFPPKHQGKLTGTFPFFKVSDMNLEGNETLMRGANNYVDEEVVRVLMARPFPAGAVIFPKVGAAVHTNKKRLLTQESLVDNNVMGVHLREGDRCDPFYLFCWFQTISLSALSNPGPLPSINGNTVKRTQVPLPPKEEQAEIGRTVAVVDAKIEAEEKRKAALQALFKAMLHHLMTGKIRVPKEGQD